MSAELPTGFEGLILSEAKPPVVNLPIGFKGIVLSFSDETNFITVKNGLGRPVEGVEVIANNGGGSAERSGFTDSNGQVNLEVSTTTTIQFKKGKYSYSINYNRTTDGNIINYRFQPYLLE